MITFVVSLSNHECNQLNQSFLKTLIDETDFALSAMLLSVLGEGSFFIITAVSASTRARSQ
ncbi:MAG: hypothetical protein Q8L97_08520 [Nitrosomonas sp.]|uniref:hypothetical protein n=1 Tax=Nitrosomonas sp. TaxID=42353 RepID=UPI002732107B|nr:hypothetical protein [Nitrosomonas sp.]MDP1550188.1 hypothetical protein [Nitrosomonas sp.]